MKHILQILASLDLRERIWGSYKRTRQAAWCVRKGMTEDKKVFALDSQTFKAISSEVGSINPILLDVSIRRVEKAGEAIARTSPIYDWLTDKAERLRFWYFLLHGRVVSA